MACYTDPVAIAAFDRMGGTDLPATTPKIPLNGSSHWGGCTGLPDVMLALAGRWVKELTMASLAEGYVYEPATVPGRKLDPEVWNSRPCWNGQYDPDFFALKTPPLRPPARGRASAWRAT